MDENDFVEGAKNASGESAESLVLQETTTSACFTPGPWRIEPIFGEGDLSIVLDYDIPDAGRPLMLAHAVEEDDFGFCPATRAEAIANARLIAAAPALYEALLELDRWYQASGKRWDAARAALALVDGSGE